MDTIRHAERQLHSPALPTSRRLREILTPALGLFLLAGSPGVTLFASRINAQESGTLNGVVSTPEKKPLSQARVAVVGTALATVADTDGTFRILALPLGAQSVEVRMLGYASVLMPV